MSVSLCICIRTRVQVSTETGRRHELLWSQSQEAVSCPEWVRHWELNQVLVTEQSALLKAGQSLKPILTFKTSSTFSYLAFDFESHLLDNLQ